MKLPDMYPKEAVVAVPTIEIARWGVRIDRVNFALKENTYISRGGEMADDGQIVDEVGARMFAKQPWQQGEDYEGAVLYAMKPALSITKLEQALEPLPVEPVTRRAASAYVEQVTLRDGLVRTGIIEKPDSECQIPIGAVAAMLYRRADIAQATDRSLWERHDTIQEQHEVIYDAARPRIVQSPLSASQSVYATVCWGEEYSEQIAGVTDGTKAWWDELRSDLRQIDTVAGRLATYGTLD